MDDMELRSLARSYLETIKMMKSGQYDGDDYRRLSADRTYYHDALITTLGPEYVRPFDMADFCRNLLAITPGGDKHE